MVKMKRPRSAASDAVSNQPRSAPVRPTSSSSTRINFGEKEGIKSPLFSRFKSTARSPSPSKSNPSSPTNENQALPSEQQQQQHENNHHSFKKPLSPPTSRAKSFVHGLQTFVGGLAMAGTVKPSSHHSHSDGASSGNGSAGVGGGDSGRSGNDSISPSSEHCKCRKINNGPNIPHPQQQLSNFTKPSSSSSYSSSSSTSTICPRCNLNIINKNNTFQSSPSPPTFIQTETGFMSQQPRRVKIDSPGDDPTVGLDVSPGWHVSEEGGFTGDHPPLKDDEDWSPAQSFPGGRLPPSLVARFSMRGKRNGGSTLATSSTSQTKKYDGEKEALKKLHEAKLRDQQERSLQDRELNGKGKEKETTSLLDQEIGSSSSASPMSPPTTTSSPSLNNAVTASSSLRRCSVIRSSTESADSRVSEFGIGFHKLGMGGSSVSSRAATPDLHNQNRLSKQEKKEESQSDQQVPSESTDQAKGMSLDQSEDKEVQALSDPVEASASIRPSSGSNGSHSLDREAVITIPASKPIPIKIDRHLPNSAFDARAASQIQISPKDVSNLNWPIPPGTSKALTAGRRPFYRLTDFEALDTLGTGTFGRVLLVKHKSEDKSSPKAYYAMKVLNKAQVVKLKQVEHINNERSILSKGPLPFTVSLYSTFQDSQNCYMLMEYVQGGEIFSHLRKARRFPVDVTRFYISLLVLSISDLHSRDIIYRDLKPENLLLDSSGYLKITDFGFSKFIPDGRTWTLCGTPEYLAPEIIQSKGHGKPVDWWALGVLMYEMLAGYPPFFDDNPFAVYEKILLGKLSFPPHIDSVSRDLIRQLLTPDRTRRLGNLSGGSDDVKNHYWFHGVQWDLLSAGKIRAPIIPRIRSPDDTCNYADYQDADPDSMPGMIGLDTPKTIADDPYSHLFSDF